MTRNARPIDLRQFVTESNRIEGIFRDPTVVELNAYERFLRIGPSVASLKTFVAAIQPEAVLRDRLGLDVIVGSYRPPLGGEHITRALELILQARGEPYLCHQYYEALHPFTDGNGRSGRVLWLWAMGGVANAPLGFMHHWYYQSLQHFGEVNWHELLVLVGSPGAHQENASVRKR